MIKTIIICLKYAPGNWQHMYSFVNSLRKSNNNVRLLISKYFIWMNKEYSNMTDYVTTSSAFANILKDIIIFFLYKWNYYANYFERYKPMIVLFVMWHPLNYYLAKIVKRLSPETKICCWMHEPYKTDKSQYRNKIFQILAIEYLQSMYVPMIDVVILHSQRALESFNLKYPQYRGKVKVIPLLFADECKKSTSAAREYDITFIGNAVKAKGIEGLFRLIKYNHELNMGLKIQLVTSSHIHYYLGNLVSGYEKYLAVINKPYISDGEIREACKRSYSVIVPYKETTQSGVVPVAFMCGTPVIGTDVEGLTECITDKKDGMIIPVDYSCKDVDYAVKYIKSNFYRLSQNARKKYKDTWDDSNWNKYYNWL